MIRVSAQASGKGARSLLPIALVVSSLAVLAAGVLTGVSTRGASILVVLVTLAAVKRPTFVSWRRLMAALCLLILLIPIRRYSLPGHLPFQLEPYRILVALLVLAWLASLLVDPRIRLRKTGFEGPLFLIVISVLGSIAANPDRVAALSSYVDKQLMFLLSFVLVLYLTASVIRRLASVDFLAKTLVAGGALLGVAAIVEARTGFNVFNHLDRVIPFLRVGQQGQTEAFQKFGAARLRAFGSAQHPIALSAAFVVLLPLSLYLARRYRQRRWIASALALIAACASTVSRTGVVMLAVVVIVFLWLRPREVRRMWPAFVVSLVVIHLVLPGTLGALKESFSPAGGLVAEQRSDVGQSGSGRLADLGPGLDEWKQQPLVGVGFGTRVVDASDTRGATANILDDQWLGTLIETGTLGAFGWLWFFVRAVGRFGAEARRDDSDRGWLLVSLAASVGAFGVGMATFDAFSFIQVTFLLFIFVGLGSALLAERPTPLAVQTSRRARDALVTER